MLNFLRDRGSTAEDKRREALGAYLDGALTAAERARFETQLARDTSLRAELEQMRALKVQMRAMPRRRAPRSFALDPALYARPKAQPMMQLHPVLRGATALTAFLLIFTLALGVFRGQFAGGGVAAPAAAEIAVSDASVEESAPAEEAAPLLLEVSPTEEVRAIPTAKQETEAAAAELAAQETITQEYSTDSALAVTGVPEGELQLEETETIVEPTVEVVAEAMATSVASANVPDDAAADSTADATALENEVVESAGDTSLASLLRPIQIVLGVVFLLSLILWLFARRRVRSF